MNPLRLRLEWAILLVVAIAGAILAYQWQITDRVDKRLLDAASAIDRPAIDERIVLIALDDASMDTLGPWPWPRSRHAELIDALASRDTALILYDVLFVDPGDPADDAALAEALRAAGNVILPHSFIAAENERAQLAPLLPLPQLMAAASDFGHVAAVPDDDGVLRRYRLAIDVDGQSYQHFAVAAWRAVQGLSLPANGAAQGLPATAAPIVRNHPPGSVTTISASAVLRGEVPAGFLAGKIVLVGATAQGMGDRYSVASGSVGLMTGVETQANFLSSLLSESTVVEVGASWVYAISILAITALFAAFWLLSPRYGLYCAIALIAGLLGLSAAMVAFAGTFMPVGGLIAVLLLAYPFWNWRRLTVVSAFLDREAQRLGPSDASVSPGMGLDFVSQQIARMRMLVRDVHASLTFLEQVIEAAPDAILVFDKEGISLMANGRAQDLFPSWPEFGEATLSQLIASAQAQFSSDRSEVEWPDGRVFLLASAKMTDDAQTAQVGQIVALRDVTDARRRRDERKEMLEFLSHDMRSPQVAIISLANEQEAGGNRDALMPRIRSQAQRTLKLADDFVQLARLQEVGIDRFETELGALVIEACDRTYSVARAKQIIVAQNLPEDPAFAEVDASLVARMLDNLIGNAIKFAPDGSTVTVTLDQPGDGTLPVCIRDEGPGFPPERRKDPFGRFGAHDTKAGPSVGLGLAFVKRVADLHDAHIEVESEEGEGTRLCVTFTQSD